jgi:agmatine/peptidylarginine deiminase
MPNAFTWTRGNEVREFKSRAELYDFMIEVGDIILEGDDAVVFEKHCNNRKAKNPKAQQALDRLQNQ